ncbi:MAG TPA: EcsC family protein [bacterium]|nr:EcsC family protein [bacterium]
MAKTKLIAIRKALFMPDQAGNMVDNSIILKTLDWAYDTALDNNGVFATATDLAEEYLKKYDDKEKALKALIRWQMTKTAVSGAITGFGGIITFPITIPANLASVLFVQLRMIAAIAYIGDHDIKSDQVRTLAYSCLLGDSAKEALKYTGIVVGKKITKNAISKISGKTLTKINKKVGFRLLTKFGEKGVVNLGKGVPIIGAVIGAFADAAYTKAIATVSVNMFISDSSDSGNEKKWFEEKYDDPFSF